MKKIISFIFIIFLISCSDIVSDYEEQEEILDYEEYLYQGWNAFEAVNLDEISQDSSSTYYYNFALGMFDASVQAIDYEFNSQNLIGPYYKSYNGIGWTQLYYSSEFLEPEFHYKRDSLRQESKIYFDKSLFSLNSQSSNSNIISKDKCDTYSGLAYLHYYNGLDTFFFDSSLMFSENLLNECSFYDFAHDELDFRNIHYLKGKIYLFQNNYSQACVAINEALDEIGCSCIDSEDIDVNILLDCFDMFSNGN